ncbi:hypothetical protein MKX01_021744 [Papaver californicum]|nr:hypothetical protein MKX01_021744 [Papaver californicum]
MVTASVQEYADNIIDFLDPEGTLISRRAYLDSGRNLADGYVKDLSVPGVDLAKVVIVGEK